MLKRLFIKGLFLFFLCDFAEAHDRVHIDEGTFAPQYGLSENQKFITIKTFWIDRAPVTNKSFFYFSNHYVPWQPQKVTAVLADRDYLKHWRGEKPLEGDDDRPVVNISWFAAEAYCKGKRGRLPTVNEWEFVAAASETQKNALSDKAFLEKLLRWYSKPTTSRLEKVKQHKPNVYGVHDLHGLVWEWTYDFNSIFVTGDNRQDKDKLKNLFCGAATVGAQDKLNYAAFMRYALRNSLKAHYTLENLGFRCAYDKAGD